MDTLIKEVFKINNPQKQALNKLGLFTLKDLLHYFPVKYDNFGEIKTIREIQENENVTLIGTIKNLDYKKTFKTKMAIATATLQDHTGEINLIWFHQPYIAKIFKENETVSIRGLVNKNKKGLYIANPDYEKFEKVPEDINYGLFKEKNTEQELYPIYSETKGISSKWFHYHIKKIISEKILDQIEDPLPHEIIQKYNLPSLNNALLYIHLPRKKEDVEIARKRFAFQEIFLIQIEKQKNHLLYERSPSWTIKNKEKEIKEFINTLPYKPTDSQLHAIDTILDDFSKNKPMSRLLEGDVGSGKTAVACATALAVVKTYPKGQDFGALQVAYMCPTEILAKQHFESFVKYFAHTKKSIALITSSECRKFPSKIDSNKSTNISKKQLLKWVENGEISITIGTHSLIEKSVKFKHLAYIIIDEQHRFGTKQRQRFTEKDKIMPHLLSMTATPIPRTLALTIYGDLDITILDQMPAGRKPIITKIVLPTERKSTYDFIEKELQNNRQLYIICPRINEPDPEKEKAIMAKSVKEEVKRLKKDVFPNFNISMLHSKMTPKEKDSVMKDFENKKIDILVATSVVEVGVNVPNATMIIIEGAERFGLAQLHQLRGRVIRSNHQAYCFIFTESKTEKTLERLKALTLAKNGFELSEYDLGLRGSGTIYGHKQWGISDFGMEAIKNIKMVEFARTEAQNLVKKDFNLDNYPKLRNLLEDGQKVIHFE